MENVQEFYDKYQEKKEQSKLLHEEISKMEEEFVEKKGLDLEYPVMVDGKQKYLRIYRPEGRFVYNTKYEIGVRATAKNLAKLDPLPEILEE